MGDIDPNVLRPDHPFAREAAERVAAEQASLDAAEREASLARPVRAVAS